MKYGLTYQGSKTDLAEWVVESIPPAPVFIDLFAGGCAVAHAAAASGKWGKVVANDATDSVMLFRDAVMGKYQNCSRWVSKEEFDLLKEVDAYARILFSFGCNGQDYMYSRDIEPYKKAMHEAVFAEGDAERRLKVGQMARELAAYFKKTGRLGGEENLLRVEICQHLQRLDRLKELRGAADLDKMEFSVRDYREVDIPEGAVVYADPPYQDMKGYGREFDHGGFFDWCRNQKAPVFVSECRMPGDFRLLKETRFVRKGRQDAVSERTERLYSMRFDGKIVRKEAVQLQLDFGRL